MIVVWATVSVRAPGSSLLRQATLTSSSSTLEAGAALGRGKGFLHGHIVVIRC